MLRIISHGETLQLLNFQVRIDTWVRTQDIQERINIGVPEFVAREFKIKE